MPELHKIGHDVWASAGAEKFEVCSTNYNVVNMDCASWGFPALRKLFLEFNSTDSKSSFIILWNSRVISNIIKIFDFQYKQLNFYCSLSGLWILLCSLLCFFHIFNGSLNLFLQHKNQQLKRKVWTTQRQTSSQ